MQKTTMQIIGLVLGLAALPPTVVSAHTHQPGQTQATSSASNASSQDFACVVMAMDYSNALQAVPTNDGHDPQRLETLRRRINYYLGKIIARDSGFDFKAALNRYEAVDRPRFSQDHPALQKFYDACVAEHEQSWSAFTGGLAKAAQK